MRRASCCSGKRPCSRSPTWCSPAAPSLYEAKRAHHANAHCFPSSVDVVHFEQALDRGNRHPLHAAIGQPRLGFYGVIDERFDPALIAALADAHPDWQIVLIGPVLKIAPDSLPQRQNVHYLGQQPYQALPHFLAGWDVCLLPFALNEATRYISPTKVLEYMAAGLPIVSTDIRDVSQPYGGLVAIGHDSASFIAHCEAALAMDADARAELAERMHAVVQRTSWEATAEQMHALMAQTPPGGRAVAAGGAMTGGAASPAAIHDAANDAANRAAKRAANRTANDADAEASNDAARPLPPATAGPAGARVNPLPGATRAQAATVVLGGGPTGLSAAYHLGAESVLLERNDSVGGWCRSIVDQGFTFDHAGHIMFSNDPYVLKLYDLLLGENQHWQMREAWVYSKNVYTRYPFQGALYGLPPDVIKECLVGAIEARYGQPPAAAATPAGPTCAPHDDCCADGGTPQLASGPAQQAASGNFEEFIYRVWGRGIARHFAIPYNRKLWTVPLQEMETSWLGGRVPLPDLEEIIDGALKPVPKPMGPNARFGYPLRGGFQALMNGFLPHLRGQLELNAEAVQVLPHEHVVALADGRRFQYRHLISTMPLPELIKLCGSAAPAAVRAAARGLRHISIRCVNIGVARAQVSDKHWIYYPEDTIFHRIFVQGNASRECNPPGGFGFTCEISYSPWKPLPLDGDALIARCVADARRVGFLRPDDRVLVANQIDMPVAYVVYDHQRAHNVATVRDWLAQHDILLAGRYSEWEYYNSDHAFLAGQRAAQQVTRLRSTARQASAKP